MKFLIHTFSGWFLVSWLVFFSACVALPPSSTAPQGTNQAALAKNNTIKPKKLTCKHKALDNGSSIRIFLAIEVERLQEAPHTDVFLKDFELNYGLLPDYKSQTFLATGNIALETVNISKNGSLHYLYFDLPKKDYAEAVLLLEIWDKTADQRLVYDVSLDFASVKLSERIALYPYQSQFPVFERYVEIGDTLLISNISTEKRSLQVIKYKLDFSPASTPMALVGSPMLNPQPDSSFVIEMGTPLSFQSEGLYFIKENDNDYYGLSFLVTKKRYPKITKITDLIEPLVYITTQEEIELLRSQSDYTLAKEEMDKLWLKLMSGNMEKARRTIKEYYKRVRLANELFTTYKQGWKTDMGMVFIIFGSPNQVRYLDDKLIWTYSNNPQFSEINFTFTKTANQFVEAEYTLQRFPEYEQIWYPAIELWREGRLGN